MKKLFLLFLSLLWATNVFAYSGAGMILVQPKNAFVPQFVSGDTLGFGLARDKCIRAGGGVIQIGPGLENLTFNYPKNANILVLRSTIAGWSADPTLLSGITSGGGYIIATANSSFTQRADFPGNGSGIQSAIDWVSSLGGGKVVLGPGVFPESTAIGLYGNVWLQGSGMGITTIKRTYFDPSGAANMGHLLITFRPNTHLANNNLVGGLAVDSLVNVSVTDLTVDGNFLAWPTVNPNAHGNFGIQFWHTDNALVENVEIRYTGQTGIELDACRNSVIRNLHTYKTGQEQMLGTRNGVNINNNDGSLAPTVNWGKNILVENCFIINQKDAGMDCANVSNVTMKNNYFFCDHDTTYGNIVHEWEGSVSGYTMQNFIIEGETAIGLNNQFWTNNIDACNLKNLIISHCYFYQGSSTVDNTRGRWPLFVKNSHAVTFRGFRVEDCVFENINAGGGISTGGFVKMYTQDVAGSGDWKFKNVTFKGANQALSDPGNVGIYLEGNLDDIEFDNVRLENVEDIGFYLTCASGHKVQNVVYNRCYVKGAEQKAFCIAGAGTIRDVKILNCTAEDTDNEVAGNAFSIEAPLNTTSNKNILLSGNNIIRNSGTNMLGGRLYQSGSGVLDSIWVINNNWAGANGAALTITGIPTHYWIEDVSTDTYKDNGTWLKWKAAAGANYLPYIRADSTNSLVLQAQTGGNIRVQKADGSIVGQWGGGSTGDLNVTGTARFQVGGYRTIEKAAGSAVYYYYHSNAGTAGNVFRDSSSSADYVHFFPNGRLWNKGSIYAGDSLGVGGGQTIAKILRASATLDFDLTATTVSDLTITCTGAADGDEVMLGVPNAAMLSTVTYTAYVNSPNTVTVRAVSETGAALNPGSGTFKVTVIH